MTTGPDAVIQFWLDAGETKWWGADPVFDEAIRSRFVSTHEAAAAGALHDWESTPEGACALVIVLDQFSRNMFRRTARAYDADPLARRVASDAIARGFDARVAPRLRAFFYLPFMHSEELADHERCVAFYRAMGDAEGSEYAEHHRDIIRRFGRFPHRNQVLGRESTPEERAFLESGGFSG